MSELNKEAFVIRGKDNVRMESISRPSLSFLAGRVETFKEKQKCIYRAMHYSSLCSACCICADVQPIYAVPRMDADARNQFISAAHWLGTDSTGRDLWTRILMGGRVSLSIGLLSAVINMCVGAVIGGLCGYYGGRLDMIVMRIVDLLYGIPSLIITILVMMVLGKGIAPLIVAMCAVGWIGTCRFVRGEVYRIREQDFVLAAKVLGISNLKIVLRHIIPNILGMLVTNLCMAIPGAIFQEAFLSYIGLGITPPDCSWGVICKEGIQYLRYSPHQVLIPAFFVCTTMLALNLLGNGLRDAVDPKLRGTE